MLIITKKYETSMNKNEVIEQKPKNYRFSSLSIEMWFEPESQSATIRNCQGFSGSWDRNHCCFFLVVNDMIYTFMTQSNW